MRHSSKKPNHVDQHVGKRSRLRRNLLGLSQDAFARRLGLTAQLIQKFEAGDTWISASRMYDVATQLAAPITWFFYELSEQRRVATTLDQAVGDAPHWSELLNMRQSRQLLEIYFGIPDERLRRKVTKVFSCCGCAMSNGLAGPAYAVSDHIQHPQGCIGAIVSEMLNASRRLLLDACHS